MFWERDEQIEILYLFLSADGKRTEQEISMFGEICEKYGVSKEEKNDAIKKSVKKLSDHKSEKNPVLASIQNLVETSYIFDSKEMQISTVWNLMSLAYADRDYAIEEKIIIDYLIKEWNINDSIQFHLKDSLDTLNNLYKHKKWISESVLDNEIKQEYLKQNSKDIDNIQKSIEQTISEFNMI